MNKQKAYKLGKEIAQDLNDKNFANGMYDKEAVGLILGFVDGITESFGDNTALKTVVKTLYDKCIDYNDNSLAFDLAPKCLKGVLIGGDLYDIEQGIVKLAQKAIKNATGGGW